MEEPGSVCFPLSPSRFLLPAPRFTLSFILRTLGVWLVLLIGDVCCIAAAEPAVIESVRHLSTDDSTRVIVTLSAETPYQVSTEPAPPADSPFSRLLIDFSPAQLGANILPLQQIDNGLLKGIHTAQVSSTTARVTIDVEQLGTYRTVALRFPHQVVIHLKRTSPSRSSLPSPLSSLPTTAQPVEPEIPEREVDEPPPVTYSTPKPRRPKRYTIVLDPGHGGQDPGAEGVGGAQEKTVVLAISKRLGRKLSERLPVTVIFTRTRDVYLSLEERTARANVANADLFISIHANASVNPASQGAETYYLNNTDDRATIRLAALENGTRQKHGQEKRTAALSFILSDLIQTGKEEESLALARALQQGLVTHARKRYAGVHNLGVKKGPFYVLVGAHMPCVLVETAFLTHPIEGRHLTSAAYQEALAEGLFQGIARFLRSGQMAKNL
jgi:N-acetylmuramoyl-L-alanine amidase